MSVGLWNAMWPCAVRLARDGTYRNYIPWDAYCRGLMNTELGVPQYGGGRSPDLMIGALPLASRSAVDNGFAVQGLSRFADVLIQLDPPAGRLYRDEAEAFRADVRRAVERDVALAPCGSHATAPTATTFPGTPIAEANA